MRETREICQSLRFLDNRRVRQASDARLPPSSAKPAPASARCSLSAPASLVDEGQSYATAEALFNAGDAATLELLRGRATRGATEHTLAGEAASACTF